MSDFPQPAEPQMSVGRPAGRPPPVISSKRAIPVGTLTSWSELETDLMGFDISRNGLRARYSFAADELSDSGGRRRLWPELKESVTASWNASLVNSAASLKVYSAARIMAFELRKARVRVDTGRRWLTDAFMR